jgi:hypothetical protein
MIDKKSAPRPYEVATSRDLMERYGLTAESRTPIQLDPARVPEEFRYLIPDAELVGESDDIRRADIMSKLSEEAKAEIDARVAPVRDELMDWVIEEGKKARQKNYEGSPEWLAFSMLTREFF